MDRITAAREAAQPIREKTGGSTFKNPPGGKAWQLVDNAGCRRLVVGDAQVSEMHCNFLINRSRASAADIEISARKCVGACARRAASNSNGRSSGSACAPAGAASAAAQLENQPDLLRILSGAPAAAIIVAGGPTAEPRAYGRRQFVAHHGRAAGERSAVAYDDIQGQSAARFLVYMPAVHAAHPRLSAGSQVVVEILLLTFASMGLSGRILRRGGAMSDEEAPLWRNAALFVF